MPKAKKSTKSTKTTDVLDIWIIDRSGSMNFGVQDTIDGFNAFLKEQREQPGNLWLSLVLFDTTFKVIYAGVPIEEVPELTPDVYYTQGMTALYDAVKIGIEGAEGWLASNPKFKGKVVIHIWTDGGENSSRLWHGSAGLNLMLDTIKAKREQGWIFNFMGSGGAAWTEGVHFQQAVGAVNTTQVTATSAGRRVSYAGASNSMATLRGRGEYLANASVTAAVCDSATLANFGVSTDEVEEALAGTSNATSE